MILILSNRVQENPSTSNIDKHMISHIIGNNFSSFTPIWILDTYATRHVYPDLNIFTKSHSYLNLYICLMDNFLKFHVLVQL